MSKTDMVCRYGEAAATVLQKGIKYPYANRSNPITLHHLLTLLATSFAGADALPILQRLLGFMSDASYVFPKPLRTHWRTIILYDFSGSGSGR